MGVFQGSDNGRRGSDTPYLHGGNIRIYMDSHVKRILHGDGCFPPCKIIYMVESVFHQLDLGLHGEGDCLDGGGQNPGIPLNPRNPKNPGNPSEPL